jgi:hypothetical protein
VQGPHLRLRRFAIRGRSRNGRAIRWRAEGRKRGLTGQKRGIMGKISPLRVSRFPFV